MRRMPTKGIDRGSHVRVTYDQDSRGFVVEYEGTLVDKRVGGPGYRESYIELANVRRLGPRGEVVGREKLKRLHDQCILECKVIDKTENAPEEKANSANPTPAASPQAIVAGSTVPVNPGMVPMWSMGMGNMGMPVMSGMGNGMGMGMAVPNACLMGNCGVNMNGVMGCVQGGMGMSMLGAGMAGALPSGMGLGVPSVGIAPGIFSTMRQDLPCGTGTSTDARSSMTSGGSSAGCPRPEGRKAAAPVVEDAAAELRGQRLSPSRSRSRSGTRCLTTFMKVQLEEARRSARR